LNVLGANLEGVFEIGGDVGDFVLQQQDDVLVVLAFLVLGSRLGRVLLRGEGLEGGDLGVEAGEVLFDDEGEFVDFDGPVVEDGLLSRHCAGLSVPWLMGQRARHAYTVRVFPAFPWWL